MTESKAAAKRLRVDVVALKKQLAKESAREIRGGGGGGGNQGSMPRSPQRRNMNVSDSLLLSKRDKLIS